MSDKAIAAKVKKIFNKGARIFVVSKNTEPKVKRMSKGYVAKVDDNGIIYVHWDNGSKSTLDSQFDLFYKI